MMNALKSKKSKRPATERKRDIGRVWHLYLYTAPFIYILNIHARSYHICGVSKQRRGELLYLWIAGMATVLISYILLLNRLLQHSICHLVGYET